MFHRDKPIDWLLDHLLWVKVCSPEKDPVSCIRLLIVRLHFDGVLLVSHSKFLHGYFLRLYITTCTLT